jgi:hypothetical protein
MAFLPVIKFLNGRFVILHCFNGIYAVRFAMVAFLIAFLLGDILRLTEAGFMIKASLHLFKKAYPVMISDFISTRKYLSFAFCSPPFV